MASAPCCLLLSSTVFGFSVDTLLDRCVAELAGASQQSLYLVLAGDVWKCADLTDLNGVFVGQLLRESLSAILPARASLKSGGVIITVGKKAPGLSAASTRLIFACAETHISCPCLPKTADQQTTPCESLLI